MMKRKIAIILILTLIFVVLVSCSGTSGEDPVQNYMTHITEILEEEGTILPDNKSTLKGDLDEGPIPSGLLYARILGEADTDPALLTGWIREGEDELPSQLYISLNKASESGTRETGHITENAAYTADDEYKVCVFFRETEEDKYIIWDSIHCGSEKTIYREKIYRLRGTKMKSLMNISIINSTTNGFNANMYSVNGTPLDENVVIPTESNKKDVKDIDRQIIEAQKECTESLKEKMSKYGLEDTVDENGYPIFEENKEQLIVTLKVAKGNYILKSYSKPVSILE